MACRSISDRVKEGELRPEDITPKTIADALLTRDVPDPDLILRTSGEQRLSNFLLFQAAYAEFVFVDKYWPAITREDFNTVLDEFARRKRRFGK
jgi:undecaprenyl diphosphate synthase